MDGVAGFEPANDRIKICWLTTCRHPMKVKKTIPDFLKKIKSFILSFAQKGNIKPLFFKKRRNNLRKDIKKYFNSCFEQFDCIFQEQLSQLKTSFPVLWDELCLYKNQADCRL